MRKLIIGIIAEFLFGRYIQSEIDAQKEFLETEYNYRDKLAELRGHNRGYEEGYKHGYDQGKYELTKQVQRNLELFEADMRDFPDADLPQVEPEQTDNKPGNDYSLDWNGFN